eukprot:gene15961-17567_t
MKDLKVLLLMLSGLLSLQTLTVYSKLYINKNGPLQLTNRLDIDIGFSFKFRTCSNGVLLEQRGGNQSYFKITLHPTSRLEHSYLAISWHINNTSYYQNIRNQVSLEKNVLVEVELMEKSLNGEHIFRILSPVKSNTTLLSSFNLLNNSATENGTFEMGLKNFTGCLFSGRNLNLLSSSNGNNFQSGCPLDDQRPCANTVCPAGFTGRNCDIDINECHSYPCHSHATCVNQINNYTCICGPRWTGRTCSTFLGSICNSSTICKNGGLCQESADRNNYTCICQQGYTGRNCEFLFDPCSLSPCRNNGSCQSYQVGSTLEYKCSCRDGRNCENDINECQTGSPCKHNGTCNNIYGGYKCVCNDRFKGPTCEEDVKECKQKPCQNNGTCTEQYGSYLCNCTLGCEVNIDECRSNPCQNNGTCIDGVNGYKCSCLGAFNGTHCENWSDLCRPSPCINNGTCINRNDTQVGYECNCTGTGFAGPHCQHKPGLCYPNNPCVHGECGDYGSYYNCTCKSGYMGVNCSQDINECDSSPCKFEGTCTNSPGSYKCNCKPYSTGVHCEIDLVDHCIPACINGGVCNNKVGYQDKCLCGTPWHGDYCQKKINFCAQDNPYCGSGHCVNIYTDRYNRAVCVCNDGYEGANCTADVDECALGYCQNHVSCKNFYGGYNCTCQAGYEGRNCTDDIDDCLNNACLNNATCIDRLNGYSCDCKLGYNGSRCEVDIDWCKSQPCANAGNCTDVVETYNCSCYPGFVGKNCEIDVDECSSNPCQYGGICLEKSNLTALGLYGRLTNDLQNNYNNRHGYVCVCPSGTNGTNCEQDVNECAINPCKNNATCHDLFNDYNCTCQPGFMDKNCSTNINECSSNPCQHNATCEDGINNYKCNCTANYHGLHCENITNQCLISNSCQNNGECYQIGISYGCKCPPGFAGSNCEHRTTMNFNSSGRIMFNSIEMIVSFGFRTTLNHGILCQIIAESNSMFIALHSEGLVIRHANGLKSYVMDSRLSNGSWHYIAVNLNSSTLTIVIDAVKVHTIAAFGMVNITKYTFGSVESNSIVQSSEFAGFVGCIRDVKLGMSVVDPMTNVSSTGVAIGACEWKQACAANPCRNSGKCQDLWTRYFCKCNRRFFGQDCNYEYESFMFGGAYEVQPVPTSKPSNSTNRRRRSIAETQTNSNQTDYVLSVVNTTFDANTSVSMSVRTRAVNGILFLLSSEGPNQGASSVLSYVTLQLVNGKLLYKFNHSSEYRSQLIDKVVTDGVWHDIEVTKSNVTVDGSLVYSPLITSDLPVKNVYIGGVDDVNFFAVALDTKLQYQGCLQAFKFQGATITSQSIGGGGQSQSINTTTATSGCNSTNVCAVNPCKNNATCNDVWNAYTCACLPGFYGANCSVFGCIAQNSCAVNETCVDVKPGVTACSTPATFNGSESSATFSNLSISDASVTFFKLKTRRSDAFIIGSGNDVNNSLAIGIRSGKISLSYTKPGMPAPSILTGNKIINDGQFHTVEIKLSSTISLTIDSVLDVSTVGASDLSLHWKTQLSSSGLQVGQSNKVYLSSQFQSIAYKGCLEYLMIGVQLLQFNTSVSVGIRNGCYSDNPCTQTTCKNGGTCMDTFDDYQCICSEFYAGATCNMTTNISCAFKPNPCFVNSTCVNLTTPATNQFSQSGFDLFRCDCNAGYMGYLCSSPTNECQGNPCIHGNCTDKHLDYTCSCESGGTCSADAAGYKCKCQDGFTGSLCHNNTDPCQNNPCSNSGSCVGVLSQCPSNNPTCVRTYVSYNCTCSGQWTGSKCENVQPCFNNPCQNGGTCIANTNTTSSNYTCACASGFKGSQCQLKVTKKDETNVAMIVGIVVGCVVLILIIGIAYMCCKGQQGMHGVYSPSRQEKGQVEMTSLPPPPPKERLI